MQLSSFYCKNNDLWLVKIDHVTEIALSDWLFPIPTPFTTLILVWPRLYSTSQETNKMQTLQGKVKYSKHLLSDEWRQPGKQRIKFNNLWQENYTFFGGKKVTQTKFLQNQKIHEACKVHSTSFWLKLCYVHFYLYVCTLYACFNSVKLYVYEFLFLNLTSKIMDKSLIYKNNQASYNTSSNKDK